MEHSKSGKEREMIEMTGNNEREDYRESDDHRLPAHWTHGKTDGIIHL